MNIANQSSPANDGKSCCSDKNRPAHALPRPHPYSQPNTIVPNVRNPYYIVAANYVRTSAGIKSLHMLCHALNQRGERAYMILHPHYPASHGFNTDWLTPVLTSRAIQSDFERGLTPITIYPETIPGNLFKAPLIVRYVMNFPGLLGGDKKYDPNEFLLAYSKNLADAVGCEDSVLFIPASDTNIFTPEPRQNRSGTCFSAAKYKYHHGGELFPETKDSVEITRDLPDSPTPKEIADLFRRSELFYCYENSALIIEALLCECPVVMLPNQYLHQAIGEHEIGQDGIAWGASPEEIARAKATAIKGKERYLQLYAEFWQQLDIFVSRTQAKAAATPYTTSMRLPYSDKRTFLSWLSDVSRMLDFIVRQQGWFKATIYTAGWIKRRGLKILP